MKMYVAWLLAANEDLITNIIQRDWAQVGGWGLFLGLVLTITIGNFTELWVPGRRYKRLEISAQKLLEANEALTTQNGELIKGNAIAKHFYEAMMPSREVTDHGHAQTERDSPRSG